MKTIWHVYIDEDHRLSMPWFPGSSSLPYADSFGVMKLFATKRGAKRYMHGLVKKLRDCLKLEGVVELPVMEATDGGEFQYGVVVYNPDCETKEATRSIWIKAVRRQVCK